MPKTSKYDHQPDFTQVSIVSRPDNVFHDNNRSLLISGPCVCGDEDHWWTASVYENNWGSNKHVSDNTMRDGWEIPK
jgi:hypothetical protein